MLFVTMNLIINNRLTTSTETSVGYFSEIKARNIGNTMAEMLLAELADDNDLRVIEPITKELFGGTAKYTIIEVGAVGDAGGEVASSHEFPANYSMKESVQYAEIFPLSIPLYFLSENLDFNESDDSDFDIEHDSDFDIESTFFLFTDHDDHDDHEDYSYDDRVLIKISVLGIYDATKKTVVVYTALPAQGYIPDATMAAVSTNNSVRTTGRLVIDGRNHDINGTLISDKGTQGLWTTDSYSQGGNSQVGGTVDGVDVAPQRNADTTIVKVSQSYYGGAYPTTPDEVLGGVSEGFPDGTAKSIAISGLNGSQYVTNPNHLTYPLSGITYVELASGSEWRPANIEGTGVLIVHNSDTDAIMKNANHGTFTGMMIVDDLVHMHADVIGGLICLSTNPSDGNTLGNGNGTILYSSEALMNATYSATGKESAPEYGMGKHRLPILAWQE